MNAMQLATAVAQGLSLIAFGWYGALTLLSDNMVPEFERYGLGRLQRIIGALQIVGAIGLLAGYYDRTLLLLSAAGLTAMMFIAVLVRVKIRDPFIATLPAIVLMCVNLFLVVRTLT